MTEISLRTRLIVASRPLLNSPWNRRNSELFAAVWPEDGKLNLPSVTHLLLLVVDEDMISAALSDNDSRTLLLRYYS